MSPAAIGVVVRIHAGEPCRGAMPGSQTTLTESLRAETPSLALVNPDWAIANSETEGLLPKPPCLLKWTSQTSGRMILMHKLVNKSQLVNRLRR